MTLTNAYKASRCGVRASRLVMAQIGLIAAAFGFAMFWPEPKGAMLLIPLASISQGDMINAITPTGAALIGEGSMPGSLVVIGQRDALMPLLARRGILILAARPILCGSAKLGRP